MKYLKSLIAVVAFVFVAALLPATITFADGSVPPVESLSKPIEVLLGCNELSDQVPSKVFASATIDDSIVNLAKNMYNQDYLDSHNLNFYEPFIQYDFSFDEGQTWIAYTPEWDTASKASEKYYNRHYCNMDYNEETNNVDASTWLFDWMEDDGTWSDPESGYCSIPGIDQYMVNRKYNEYEIPYFDFNVNTLTVRARVGMAYRSNDVDEASYMFSDWTVSKPYGNFKADDKNGNLLVNGDFEDGLKGWVDSDKCWDAVQSAECHEGRHGRYLTWPVYANNGSKSIDYDESIYLYQDVSLDGYKAGQTAVFNCMICNYDQGDGDMGTASLIFIDKDGKAISSSEFVYRNPNWISRSIVASIPKGAVKARVKFAATLYAGNDVDVYLDYCSLVITDEEVYPVSISEKNNIWQAQTGDILHLVANNGVSTDPSDFTWYSSYESAAYVDSNGVVTMKGDASNGAFIYATDKKSGVAGVYMINIEDPNRAVNLGTGASLKTDDGATVKLLPDSASGNEVEYTPATKSGKVVIPDTVTVNGVTYKITEIEKDAFKNSAITEVKIGKYVTKIGNGAFSGCTKLKKVTIGASVKTIGDKAFYGCKALKSVTIPAKVTKIGKSAFEKCTALNTVTIKSKSVTFGSKSLKSIGTKAKVTAPKKLKNAAKLIKKAGVSGKKQTIKVK